VALHQPIIYIRNNFGGMDPKDANLANELDPSFNFIALFIACDFMVC